VVDQAILTGRIDRALPEIKRIAVEAMLGEYSTEEDALKQIAAKMYAAYRDDYPEVFEQRRVALDAAVLATQNGFKQNMFPEMKVTWEGYPDNIGHFIFAGCMRCHDGKKKSDDGGVVTRDCTACHTIMRQGSGPNFQVATTEQGLEFVHPDGGDDWRDTNCHECHTGTQP
jgi:hypothetical protein